MVIFLLTVRQQNCATSTRKVKLYFKDQTTPASGTLIADQTYEWEGLTSKQALQVVNSLQAHLNDFEYQRGSLDDAFINITGKELQ